MGTTGTDDGLLWIALVVLAAIVLVPLVTMAVAMPMMGMMGWGWMGGAVGSRASPLWGIGMTLVWLAVLLGVGYVLYRGLVGRADAGGTADPALAELRLAYARGELTNEEYEERRERLQAGGGVGSGAGGSGQESSSRPRAGE